MRRFPDGFLFGVATSGHQTEGGNSSSDTWFLENVRPTVFADRSGRACNSWELWREDLDLVGAMRLGAFRFVGKEDRFARLAARVVEIGRQPRARVIDLLIAATAHAHDAAVYTRNADDLAGLEDLIAIHRI